MTLETKKSRILSIVCFFVLLSSFSSRIVWAAPNTELVFSSLPDQRPGTMIAQQVLRQAYHRLGVSIRFVTLPNARIRELLETEELDGVDYRISDAPVGDLKKISPAITYEEFVVYTVNKIFKVDGYSSLRPYSIGYLSGARIFEDKLRGMRVDTAPTLESLFRKLVAGRTDLAIDSSSGICLIRKLGLTQIQTLNHPLERILGYHWLSGRHAELIPKLEATLRLMDKDGSIAKIQKTVISEFTASCGN